ncbi:LOB domain-containing protein CRL1 [Glycine soja]
MTGFGSSCGACKFLRRKCTSDCVFAPYFSYDQASTHFAAVHKIYGASNVSKLLSHLPIQNRSDAAVTISYEALARMQDPIYGCVAHIYALQHQVSDSTVYFITPQFMDLDSLQLNFHAFTSYEDRKAHILFRLKSESSGFHSAVINVASLQEEIDVLGNLVANSSVSVVNCGSVQATINSNNGTQFNILQHDATRTQYCQNNLANFLSQEGSATVFQSLINSQMDIELPNCTQVEQPSFGDFNSNPLEQFLSGIDQEMFVNHPWFKHNADIKN